MTIRPAVLIMQRHLGQLTPFLEGAYDVYRFWEGPPAEVEARIGAIVVAGEFELDKALIAALHDEGFEIGIETNGTLLPPPGIDWICVSPKAGAEQKLMHGRSEEHTSELQSH